MRKHSLLPTVFLILSTNRLYFKFSQVKCQFVSTMFKQNDCSVKTSGIATEIKKKLAIFTICGVSLQKYM